MNGNELREMRARMDEDFKVLPGMMATIRDANKFEFASIRASLQGVQESMSRVEDNHAKFEITLFHWMGSVQGTMDALADTVEYAETELERLKDMPDRVAELERRLAG